MVLPLANAGTLQQLLQRRKQQGSPLAPAESKTILRGILGGVAYLHRHGVAHRDLKPENILLHRMPTATAFSFILQQKGLSALSPLGRKEEHMGEGCIEGDLPTPLISDFGLAAETSQAQLRTFCGTVDFLSPEPIASRFFAGGIREVIAGKTANGFLKEDPCIMFILLFYLLPILYPPVLYLTFFPFQLLHTQIAEEVHLRSVRRAKKAQEKILALSVTNRKVKWLKVLRLGCASFLTQ